MKFSPQQDDALKAVDAWYRSRETQLFRLFGYAGTGKTTLARHFAENIDGEVHFAAFTGKAAQVLREKGNENARTLHSLIYRPRGEEEDDEDGSVNPTFSLNRKSDLAKAHLLIVDECSMVDEELGRDVLSFGVPVLVLGDQGQLPPISGGGFFTEAEPDFLLTEIHRQANENPIIDLARKARQGEKIPYGDFGKARVISRNDVDSSEVLRADQVLVGINRTRRKYNTRLRELNGYQTPYPEKHDKLVCLRNNNQRGLLNGSLWQVTSPGKVGGRHLQMLVRPEEKGNSAPRVKIKVLRAAFEEGAEEIPWQQRRNADEFDYGYALTVHKAQGSQWDNVYLFDESYAFRDTRDRWLYTAITRAADELTLVR